MAQSQHCDLCAEEPAQVTIITNASGDVIMIGSNCMIIFYLTAAAEILGAMPEQNRMAYAEVLQPITEKLAAIDGRAGDDIAGPAAPYDDEIYRLATGTSLDDAQAPAQGTDGDGAALQAQGGSDAI